MLKYFAANRNRWLSALPNVGPYIYDVKICGFTRSSIYTGLFISPSGISELDCATTKTDTAERSISISIKSLQVVFLY
jgi:hypothetical protein